MASANGGRGFLVGLGSQVYCPPKFVTSTASILRFLWDFPVCSLFLAFWASTYCPMDLDWFCQVQIVPFSTVLSFFRVKESMFSPWSGLYVCLMFSLSATWNSHCLNVSQELSQLIPLICFKSMGHLWNIIKNASEHVQSIGSSKVTTWL